MNFQPEELVKAGQEGQEGGSSSIAALLGTLSVPAGLFYAQQTMPFNRETNIRQTTSTSDVVSTSLFDNLVKLAEVNPVKRETKKRANNKGMKKKRKTRRV